MRSLLFLVPCLTFTVTAAWADSKKVAPAQPSTLAARADVSRVHELKSKDDGRHEDDDGEEGHPSGPSNVLAFVAPASVSPSPFDPGRQVTALHLQLAVRPVDGLNAERSKGRDDDDEDDNEHPDPRKQFLIRTTWRIAAAGGAVTIRKDVPITPPFQIVRVPKAPGRGTRTAILVPVSLAWDGRSAAGGCLPNGALSWTVEASFLRLKVGKRTTQEKLIGQVSSSGSVTIQGEAPVLTVTSPRDGFVTRRLSVSFGGAIQGEAPLSLSISGSTVPVSSGLFAVDLPLAQEGLNSFELIATGCGDRTGPASRATRTVFRDTVAPVVLAVEPLDQSTVETAPRVRVSFSDAAPSSSLNLASFKLLLDGQEVTGAEVTATGATFTVPTGSALSSSSHTIQASIADSAGNTGTANASFTVRSPIVAPPVPSDAGFATGLVIDGATGGALPSARVQVVGQVATVLTNATGRYVFPLSPGSYRLLVTKPGYAGEVERRFTIEQGRDTAVATVSLFPADGSPTLVTAAQGGTVTNGAGTIRIDIPPGALAADTALRFTQVSGRDALSGTPPDLLVGSSFMVEPEGVVLLAPVTVTVNNDQHLAPGHPLLALAFDHESGCWEPSGGGQVSADGSKVVVQTSHFSKLGVT